jgi:rhodanese-related sulfurtransferase
MGSAIPLDRQTGFDSAHDGQHEGRASGCGSYRALLPAELERMPSATIVALKIADASQRFAGFATVLALPSARDLAEHLAELPVGQPVVVVCPDGDCSSRVATRLANDGRTVYHLAGGLRDWNYHRRPACGHCR